MTTPEAVLRATTADIEPADVLDAALREVGVIDAPAYTMTAAEEQRRALCRKLDANYRSCVAELLRAAHRLERVSPDAALHLRREAHDLAINGALRVTAAGRTP